MHTSADVRVDRSLLEGVTMCSSLTITSRLLFGEFTTLASGDHLSRRACRSQKRYTPLLFIAALPHRTHTWLARAVAASTI